MEMGLFDFFKRKTKIEHQVSVDSLPRDFGVKNNKVSKPKNKSVPLDRKYDNYLDVPESKLERWYTLKKVKGHTFPKKEYIAIMEIIGKKYEAGLLREIEDWNIGNYSHWLKEKKKEGKVITSKVYAKAMAYSRGDDWKSDVDFELSEKPNVDKKEQEWLDDIYDNCSIDEEEDIHACRKEDNKLMKELEVEFSKGKIKTNEDASVWYDTEKEFKVYKVKFLRKRVVKRLKKSNLKLIKLYS